ncbi:MAG: tRNA (adenosine(37)-N6)-threonylcarbamoyltransferase complex ATPase subunit type 1 TsaE [Chloroflexi bacterium]|nr:tRNA (adenosine(37)-N6)-threonylcarbamoyltransferase complex ATPase subunit type 1 TsaE [Chloroflexota bacterium]
MPILDAHTFEFFSRSPEQTRRIGMRLGGLLQPGDLICLQGDLGAGKTTFVQGLAQGWGSLDGVSSPTFVLVNEYGRPDEEKLFHMDAYRLESAPEAAELDLDSMLADSALIIEWPERVESILPPERLWLHLEYMAEEHRQIIFKACGQRYDKVLSDLQKTLFAVSHRRTSGTNGGVP